MEATSIYLDPEIKAKAESTFSEFGFNLSEAINVFLQMAIKKRGFPFAFFCLKKFQLLCIL